MSMIMLINFHYKKNECFFMFQIRKKKLCLCKIRIFNFRNKLKLTYLWF